MSLLTNFSHRHLVYNFSRPQTRLADLVSFLFWWFSFGIYGSLLTYLSHVYSCIWSVMSSDYADWQDIICSFHFVSIGLYWYLQVSFGLYGSLLIFMGLFWHTSHTYAADYGISCHQITLTGRVSFCSIGLFWYLWVSFDTAYHYSPPSTPYDLAPHDSPP